MVSRGLVVAILALSLVVTTMGSVATGQDDMRRLVEALAMDVPVRSMLAPPFSLPRLDGTDVRLSTLEGRIVMLYFWTTW
jgi:hypothetical protein